MSHRALEPNEIEQRTAALNAAARAPWTVRDGKLCKEFRFRDFVEAFGFMAQVALVAERSNHHPEWFNVYATVRVELVTHDVSGLSERDFALAAAMESIARGPSG